jgi:hypothetical protein
MAGRARARGICHSTRLPGPARFSKVSVRRQVAGALHGPFGRDNFTRRFQQAYGLHDGFADFFASLLNTRIGVGAQAIRYQQCRSKRPVDAVA